MHCLSFPCSEPTALHENSTLVARTQSFLGLPRDYLAVRTTRAHHPQFRALSWRTCLNPALSKHYPNKRVLLPLGGLFPGSQCSFPQNPPPITRWARGSNCKLLFSTKQLQQILSHPSTPNGRHNYTSPKPSSLQETTARPYKPLSSLTLPTLLSSLLLRVLARQANS